MKVVLVDLPYSMVFIIDEIEIFISVYHVSNCFLLHKMLNVLKSYQGPSQLFQVRGVDEVSTKAFEVMPVSVKELDNFYAHTSMKSTDKESRKLKSFGVNISEKDEF